MISKRFRLCQGTCRCKIHVFVHCTLKDFITIMLCLRDMANMPKILTK